MLLIPCPNCGPRAEIEFHCGGEAHIQRPSDPSLAKDDVWAEYLFMRQNTKGVSYEQWWHVHGCRRWFNVARDSVTDTIQAVYPINAPPPVYFGGDKRNV
ncbi:MAG: sarcosine oxidase subunit delta [Pseudomonadota bacterium]